MSIRCSPLFGAAAAILLLAGAPRASRAAQGAVDHGEILLDELNCAACHAAPPQAADRFFIREGPRLGSQGLRLTPQWLATFLAGPAHPGDTMPDMLHGMTPEEKAGAIRDLTQYLVSREAPEDPGFEADASLIRQGGVLYHTVGCVACHLPSEVPSWSGNGADAGFSTAGMEKNVDRFADLPRMTSVPQLAAFLRDPLRFHPAGRMPSMKLTDPEATAIAAYLLGKQAGGGPQDIPGVRYEYFEKHAANLPNFDRLKVVATGSVPTFDLSPRKRDDDIALRYRGNLEVPTEGEYRFYTVSDDGSKLLIDGREVVNNDGIHAMWEQSGSITLKPGRHAITVLYFNAAADFGLEVSWEGPGFAKQLIPASALSHSSLLMKPIDEQPFVPDAAGAARGRALFAQLNCAACHQGDIMAGARGKPLAELTLDGTSDCLSAAPARSLPLYTLTPEEREAIRSTLRDPARLSRPLDPHALIDRTMTLLNCYACHERDGQGGPDELRRHYFTSLPPDLDLGDEGRLPPRLTGVGAKLQEEWIGRVLLEGASVRPYMATRMPQFGPENVGFLPAAFLAADGGEVENPGFHGDAASQKAGRKLAGITGLACIACHNFAGHPSLGIPAIDLTVMAGRLQTGWFQRYLMDPQSLRPGTRMPGFWPGGKAVNRDILGSDAGAQIAALWSFLSQGRSAELPDGLIRGRMELVADKQAVIYRNFIQGAGVRAIGVGYPEKANLAFDADDLRIALIWHGAFLDAAEQRTGRGMGTAVPPMGHDVLAGPPGAPFALLTGPADPWPAPAGKSAGYQFRGYHLDDVLRPAFSYDFGGIRITDYPVAVPGKDDPGLKRTLTFETADPPEDLNRRLFMRAAVGNKIERTPVGDFIVDGRLTLRFVIPGDMVWTLESGTKPMPVLGHTGAVVRKTQAGMELLVPIRFIGRKASIEEDYIW